MYYLTEGGNTYTEHSKHNIKNGIDLKVLDFCASQPPQSEKTVDVWDKTPALYMTS